MGQAISELASRDKRIKLTGLLEVKDSPALGTERYGVRVTDSPAEALRNADAAIDFTAPSATPAHAALAAQAGVALVVGTTGVGGVAWKALEEAARAVPVVASTNMRLSPNFLFDVVERVAALLPGYDAEITQIHQNLEKDAPSGTAQRLAESVQRGRQNGRFVYGRHGLVGERSPEEIGVHAVRGGDVVGDHTVLFLGNGERVELVHRVTSRAAFAAGAVAAAKWTTGRSPGLYDMRDVLGLKK